MLSASFIPVLPKVIPKMVIGVIGARYHVSDWLDTQIENLGAGIVTAGHRLTTGGAPGSDQAAIRGAMSKRPSAVHAFLPWDTFEEINLAQVSKSVPEQVNNPDQEFRDLLAYYYDRSWESIKATTQKTMARNYAIIKSSDLIKAFPNMKDGHPTGGTAFGIWLASTLHKQVQVYPTDTKYDQWDICSDCGCHRTIWDCGSQFHKLKPYN